MANRILTINIRNYLVKQPRRKRPARISRWIRYRIAHSANIKSDSIRITKELNSIVLKKYLHSMKPLKVNISTDKGISTVTYFSSAAKPVEAKAQTATTKDTKEAPKATSAPKAAPAPKKAEKAAAPKAPEDKKDAGK
ncbi:MAG: hypothetical protein ABSA33_00250 [Candidatus Micrarchaeaceae archaeon]|jgi:ribosomal protein L31E